METKKKTIKDKEYQVTPFTAIEGLKLKAYLLKLVGPAIGEIAGSGLDSEINIAKAIEKITSVLDEVTFINLIKRLMANVIVSGKNPNTGETFMLAFNSDFETALDIVFKGELFSIYQVLAFVLEVNYPDFFELIKPVIGQKMPIIGSSVKQKVKLNGGLIE